MSATTASTGSAKRRARDKTPDSHDFPTRSYDLVKEFVIALGVVTVLTIVLAAIFSSPDEKALTLQDWAKANPNDVVATAASELSGDAGTAGYGPPYNTAGDGQKLLGVPLQKWAGVTHPIDAANDFVVNPLKTVRGDSTLTAALSQWTAASADQQGKWSSAYVAALTSNKVGGDPAKVPTGNYGPVPEMSQAYEKLAASGGLEQLVAGNDFYRADPTKPLLLLADGSYLSDQATARSLAGDQWGMMNEAGNYPGQPWLWLYTFWYQIDPFKSSPNADALVWGLMMFLTAILALIPFIPGLRDIPRWIPIHRLIWRNWYRDHPPATK